jgi:hypothetical protein
MNFQGTPWGKNPENAPKGCGFGDFFYLFRFIHRVIFRIPN